MRFQGTITKWMDEEGYGFVTPRGGGKQVFIHISALDKSLVRPQLDQVVSYELEVDDNNRRRARCVQYVGAGNHRSVGFPKWPFAFALAILTCLVVWWSAGSLPGIIPPFITALSLISYLVYGYDKSQAKTNGWRVPESTIHLLALFGGWPGALCAQHVMRHKIRKASFMGAFWLTVTLNCVALLLLSTPFGVELIKLSIW